MNHRLLTTPNKVNRGLTPKLLRLLARMRRLGVSTWDVAVDSGYSDAYCWMVLNGRRRQPKVLTSAEGLCKRKAAESKAAESA